MTRMDVLQRLAALEAVLQGRVPDAPPVPTPEDLAQCRPWAVKVGHTIVHVVYDSPLPHDGDEGTEAL